MNFLVILILLFFLKGNLNIWFFSSNGDLDPWSAGGVKQSLSDSLVAILIPDGAHHLDLRSNSDFDPKSVIEARALEVAYMKKWIEEYRQQLNIQDF